MNTAILITFCIVIISWFVGIVCFAASGIIGDTIKEERYSSDEERIFNLTKRHTRVIFTEEISAAICSISLIVFIVLLIIAQP